MLEPPADPSPRRQIRRPLGRLRRAMAVRERAWRLAVTPRRYLPPRVRNRVKPAVGLVGYYGWGNYGDELFERVFRERLDHDVRLRLVLDRTARPNAKVSLSRAVSRSDAIVIGGGDLVVPWLDRNIYWSTEYLRRPVFVSGVGAATWKRPTARGHRPAPPLLPPSQREGHPRPRPREPALARGARRAARAGCLIGRSRLCARPAAGRPPDGPADLRARRPMAPGSDRPDPGSRAGRTSGGAGLSRPAHRPGDGSDPRAR